MMPAESRLRSAIGLARVIIAAGAVLVLLLAPAGLPAAAAETIRSGHPPVLQSASIDAQRRLVVTYSAPDGVTYGGTVYLDNNPQNATVPPPNQYGSFMYCNNKSNCLGRWKLSATPGTGPFTFTTEPLDLTRFPGGTYWVQVETTNEDPFASTRQWEDSNVMTVTLPSAVPPPRQPVSLASVSNGCGGGEVGNKPRFGDEVTFDSGTKGLRFKVRFRVACNVHDAGYGGYKIRNPMHNNAVVDYMTVPRKTIDDQFRTDLKLLCKQQLPKSAAAAKAKCYKYADAYYALVRVGGWKFFDADPEQPGQQATGPRSNL